MEKALKFLLLATIISVIFGPLAAIPLAVPGLNFYLTDLLVGISALFLLIYLLKRKKKLTTTPVLIQLGIFLLVAIMSIIISPVDLDIYERVVSVLYLVRYIAYFTIYLTAGALLEKKVITGDFVFKLSLAIGLVLILGGWIQYFWYPDLRNLSYLGWDPHYKRIFSSFLDPNYLGLIYVFIFIILIHIKVKKIARWIACALVILSLAFTYSRSSYLAFISAISFYGFKSKNSSKYFSLAFVFLILAIVYLPRPGGEGVRLERLFSVTERINNWKNALTISFNNPILGVGFNTLRYAQKKYDFLPHDWLTSHSAAGVDNSFLFVLATTGIVGLIAFVLLLLKLYQASTVFGKAILLSSTIHSLFLNSLFYPWIMVFMWTLLAVDHFHQGE